MANTKKTENEVKRTGLYWPGKRMEVERVALPFQVVETVNVSRATREEAPLFAATRGQEAGGWRNKLIWGENKYIMASLLDQGFAGKINLIYIDPPFATGADFSVRMKVGDEQWTKEASVIEEKTYRDTWGKGLDSYLQMIYDRLVLMRELLAEDGSIFVHVDPNIGPYMKLLLAEIFGSDRSVSDIVWRRIYTHSDAHGFGVIHDNIFWYAKSDSYTWKVQYVPYSREYVESHYTQVDTEGRRCQLISCSAKGAGPPRRFGGKVLAPPPGTHWKWRQETIDHLVAEGKIVFTSGGTPRLKRYLDEAPGRVVHSIWTDVYPVNSQAIERVNYDTQKPEALVERVMRASSDEGDLVADFFCGSGTTGAVAEKLGRRWIMADLSRFAIQVTRKRLLDIPDCKPFEILDLGKYERQYWRGHVNGQGVRQDEVLARYLDFIVQLYRGEGVTGFAHLHGRKAGRMVHVGGVDAPVTLSEINDALDECAANRFRGLDVLGWEWEMGLHDLVTVEGRKRGVDLRLLTIPREVMDPRAVEAGDIEFYELAYLDVTLERRGSETQVVLRNFIIPNEDLVPAEVREKIKRWSDYVDFWGVDWDFQGDTFHNQWQSYRTRKHPALRLESDWHTCDRPGKYQVPALSVAEVMVKVIDIFGNDTTKLLRVDVR